MDIVGYSDPLSVAPGDEIKFHVSAVGSSFDAALVRLVHGNVDDAGPGFKEERVPAEIDGTYPARLQGFRQGSHVRVPSPPDLPAGSGFTLQAWVCPTAPGGRAQVVMGAWSTDRDRGFCLGLDEAARPRLWLGGPEGMWAAVGSRPVHPSTWQFLAGAFDGDGGVVALVCWDVGRWAPASLDAQVVDVPAGVSWSVESPFMIASATGEDGPAMPYTGLVDTPRVFDAPLGPEALRQLHGGDEPARVVDAGLAAEWNLGEVSSTRRVRDTSGHGHDGVAVNLPRRGIPGWNWTGEEVCFRAAPDSYGAMFFHEEDMEDAAWETAFQFEVPQDLPSGIYAARLRTGDAEDHVPFFVTPQRGQPASRIALLVPTFSYLAYANDHATWRNPAVPPPPGAVEQLCAEDRYALENQLKGLYDRFSDGTGCCFSSRRRPIVNMRPRYRLAVTGTPHQFSADLHLVDWLTTKGFAFDVVTDEDLHAEGQTLLDPYSVVLTGHHPEYATARMLDALEGYTDSGGRLMYMGGNGFYWVISTEPGHPHVIEIRRGLRGTSTWRGRVGEGWHQTTGEPGGLWRDRGRPPQRLVGIGMAAQGTGPARPYHRHEASSDPRAAWIFEGVDDHGPIGDFGLMLGGAAGIEVDRFDHDLQTPSHALFLATADGFDDAYQHVVEEVETSDSLQRGSVNPFVRADLTYFETRRGGAVFSVGSMTWVGSLSHADYDNGVSRITENVLRRFAADEPLPPPPEGEA